MEYENGENISLVDTLVAVGKEAGVSDEQDLTSYLAENKGKSQVKGEIEIGRRKYRISGVPFFIVGSDKSERPYGFSGAQSSETFLELFQELSEE